MAEAPRAAPRLIVFTDTTRAARAELLTRFSELGRRAAPGSVLFVLRDYVLSARQRWELGIELSAIAARHAQRFGIADRADLALALSARALHLPERGLTARDARRLLGENVFLSQACHDPDRAPDFELDARLISPIFEPRKGRPALGLPALGRSAEHAARPALFALGAVDASNGAACLAAGAAGVAVIGAALTPEPAALLDALGILRK
jgi:thiamine-phosphate pyrophosphorylase